MNTIDKLLKEWLSLQPLQKEKQRDMDQQFMLDFNYNSNHLEGNTLTYGQTKLLLLFGDTMGNASIQDYEEMKAHNVGLELIKIEALDKERPLSEMFIRELNKTILVRDFYKTSRDGDYRYKIHVGVYKTRPNSVVTTTGELFDYASPEETSALMSDLVRCYNEEERKANLSPVELATLFHYRYIRIHPFEDGNGRVARLLVNYILLRHHYPMIVIRTDDRKNYIEALHQCDLAVGKIPSDGANAEMKQIEPLFQYIANIVERKLTFAIQLAKGEIREIVETNETADEHTLLLSDLQKNIILLMLENQKITYADMATKLNTTPRTLSKNIARLRELKFIGRRGSHRLGEWVVLKSV